MKINLPQKVTGSLHSHGCWSDYRNPYEIKRFAFDLETFLVHCLNSGKSFQGITDIVANKKNQPGFKESRYAELLKTAKANKQYHLEQRDNESWIYHDSGIFFIPQTLEILTDKPLRHILAFGSGKNITPERSAYDTLRQIRDLGGYAIINHPFMGNAWSEEEIISLFEKELILALEWNGGMTFPSSLPRFLRNRLPNRGNNKRVLSLGEKASIPVIANDDAHSGKDIFQGADTTYDFERESKSFIEGIANAIKQGRFTRNERYSSFLSPFTHVIHGISSQIKFGKSGLPAA